MEKIFIKPAPGIRLFYPETKSMVPDEGIFVERNQYWRRRINDGGAIIFDPIAKIIQKAAKTKEGKTKNP